MNYTYFGQKEYGWFKTGVIGTNNVGPCIVLFIYHKPTKNCFAFHTDSGISIEGIMSAATEFLQIDPIKNNFCAFLVGGWKYHENNLGGAEEIIAWLQKIGIVKIDSSRLFNKDSINGQIVITSYYRVVAFNLSTGKILLNEHNENSLVCNIERNQVANRMYWECLEYLLNNTEATVSAIRSSLLSQRSIILDAEIETFFTQVITRSNGFPTIPYHDLALKAERDLRNLAVNALRGNVLVFAKELYATCICPSRPIPNMIANLTVLHFACSGLVKSQESYAHKTIIMLLLLRIRKNPNFNNEAKIIALLPDDAFKAACQELITALKFCALRENEDLTTLISRTTQVNTFILLINYFCYVKLPIYSSKRAIIENDLLRTAFAIIDTVNSAKTHPEEPIDAEKIVYLDPHVLKETAPRKLLNS